MQLKSESCIKVNPTRAKKYLFFGKKHDKQPVTIDILTFYGLTELSCIFENVAFIIVVMSNFSKALRKIMKSPANSITGADLAKALGKSTGHISKMVRGKQASIAAADMEQLLRSVFRHPADQAELLQARCLDSLLCPDGLTPLPGANQIDVSIRSDVLHDKPVETIQRLSPEFEEAMTYFRNLAIQNDEAESWLISQAKLSGMKATPPRE